MPRVPDFTQTAALLHMIAEGAQCSEEERALHAMAADWLDYWIRDGRLADDPDIAEFLDRCVQGLIFAQPAARLTRWHH